MAEAFQFPWRALSVVCEGTSVLDIESLELKDEIEAHQFVLSYGFDLYEPVHVEQIQKIFEQALGFIEKYLCTTDLQLPPVLKKLKMERDLKVLLLRASQNVTNNLEVNSLHPFWVCAVLRVMHAISHMQSDLRLKYLTKIKRQTVDRFSAHIQESQGLTYLGFEGDKIPLLSFQKKESKVKDSILLKILHKASSTAQEVHDHIGVRFVTKDRIDALRVIKYLIDHHLVAYPNVMAARCRNSLISLEALKSAVESVADEAAIRAIERGLSYPSTADRQNAFSASEYHSIQFTARQLIRIPVIRKGGQRREMAFFFPLEVQIFDEKAFNEALTGEAAHRAYKQKQLDAVRQRVLRGLVF